MNANKTSSANGITVSPVPMNTSGITNIVIDPDRSEYVAFEGRYFGDVGQYEKIRGTAYGELDPKDPQNSVITDIEFAQTNSKGMVEYSMDIFILKPKDLSKGNHRVLFDFNNLSLIHI